MVSPSVSIQGWGLTVNVDRLCHAPLEPLRFLVQNRHFVGGEWVFCLGQMFPNRGRRSFMVFCDPVLELSSRLTYIGSRALSTLDAIDDAWFVLFGNLVLGPPQESGCCCRASGGLQRLPSWWFWLGRRTHVPRRAGWRALSGGSVEGPVGQWGVSRGRRCPSLFWYNPTLTRLSSSVQALVVWPLRWSK